MAGIGLRRSGLGGAAESLADAERALDLAVRQGRTVRFEDEWLTATLVTHAARLRPLLAPGLHVDQPHLAAAVLAFVEHGLSVPGAAEALEVHGNTVKYRLSRWRELTGWDPHTLDGLARSLLVLASGGQRSSPGVPGGG